MAVITGRIVHRGGLVLDVTDPRPILLLPFSTDSYFHPLVFVFVHDRYQSYKYEKYSREICYILDVIDRSGRKSRRKRVISP